MVSKKIERNPLLGEGRIPKVGRDDPLPTTSSETRLTDLLTSLLEKKGYPAVTNFLSVTKGTIKT